MRDPLHAMFWLLLAVPWLQGCGEECAPMLWENVGNFEVTLSVAAPPLPDDLQVMLTGDEAAVVLTLTEILGDTSDRPSCWLGSLDDNPQLHPDADAAAPDASRISCVWGHGEKGTFTATASGYHDVSQSLQATAQECECSCQPWLQDRAEIELQPL